MNRRVLIVEDEEVIREAYTMILGASGFEVFTATNGVEGLKQMKLRRPDIVLLDVFMPIMDGLTFLKNLDLNEYPNAVIIACTNLSDADTKNEMMRLGCVDVVLKSDLNPSELTELVQTQLKK